jgi:hypothetical protein
MIMRRYSSENYTGITSLEEIRLEKSRLLLKGKLLESRIALDVGGVREKFSLAALVASFARSFILPRVSDLLGSLLKTVEKES